MTLDPSPITPDELRAILAQLGISQNELARRIGVTSTTVNNWTAGRYPVVGPAAIVIRSLTKNDLTLNNLK